MLALVVAYYIVYLFIIKMIFYRFGVRFAGLLVKGSVRCSGKVLVGMVKTVFR